MGCGREGGEEGGGGLLGWWEENHGGQEQPEKDGKGAVGQRKRRGVRLSMLCDHAIAQARDLGAARRRRESKDSASTARYRQVRIGEKSFGGKRTREQGFCNFRTPGYVLRPLYCHLRNKRFRNGTTSTASTPLENVSEGRVAIVATANELVELARVLLLVPPVTERDVRPDKYPRSAKQAEHNGMAFDVRGSLSRGVDLFKSVSG